MANLYQVDIVLECQLIPAETDTEVYNILSDYADKLSEVLGDERIAWEDCRFEISKIEHKTEQENENG